MTGTDFTPHPQPGTSYALMALLEKGGACNEARAWAKDKTAQEAWEQCERGDWMLWAAAVAGVDIRCITEAALACVEPALVFIPPGEFRPNALYLALRQYSAGQGTMAAVETTHLAVVAALQEGAWPRSEVYTMRAIRSIAKLVLGARDSEYAASDAVCYAADAVCYAADAVCYAADAVCYAEDAWRECVLWRDDCASREAYLLSMRRSANMVRKMIPFESVGRGV